MHKVWFFYSVVLWKFSFFMHDVWDGWITRCLSFSCDFCVTSEKYTEIIIINNRIHHYFFMSIIFICLIFLKHHTLLMVVHGVPWIFMCVCVHLILDIGLNFHTSAFSLCFRSVTVFFFLFFFLQCLKRLLLLLVCFTTYRTLFLLCCIQILMCFFMLEFPFKLRKGSHVLSFSAP